MSLIELSLLNGCQRAFPLVRHPYATVARAFGVTERELLALLARLMAERKVSRVGAVFAPGRIGAGTLAALAVPEGELDRIGALVSSFAGVNHNYQREHSFNLWFVATAQDENRLAQSLESIAAQTGCPLIVAPLEEEFRIDLGFDLRGHTAVGHTARSYLHQRLSLDETERAIIRALQRGLALVPEPFAAIAAKAETTEAHVLSVLERWVAEGTIRRFGLIVRHRELGYVANAMIVWDVPDADASKFGARLAAEPGVTLAYRRRRSPPHWRYNLYCMVHGRERERVERRIAEIRSSTGLAAHPHAVLFSRRCFKQTAAAYVDDMRALAHG